MSTTYRRALGVAGAAATLLLATVAPADADTTVHGDLVQQNRSGVEGTVTITARDDGSIRVRIHATGMVPGPHAQHIHGSLQGGMFHCATPAADKDGDGWLTNEEATGEYGSAFLALTTRGDTSGKSGLAIDRMPVADKQGRLDYDRTIPAAQVPDGLVGQLASTHVVQHGIDANGNGKYDLDALGESTFAKSLGAPGVPEEATDPASCGMVMAASAGNAAHGAVAAGAESTEGVESAPLLLLGAGLVGVAGAVEVARRRRRGRG
jgi:hypothetical protein